MRGKYFYEEDEEKEYSKKDNCCSKDLSKCRNNRRFFNTYEFDRLIKMIDYDIHGAREGFEDYLLKYPNDLNAYAQYASLLISTGNLDRVEEILTRIEYKMETDSIYKQDPVKYDILRKNVIYNRARLYVFINKEWEALKIMLQNKEVFPNVGKSRIFYLRSRTNNHIDRNRREPNSYIFRQIVEYREDDMIDHIKKHEADFNENDREISTSFFAPEVPIEKLIEEVKRNFRPENAINKGFAGQTYTFKYDECGRDDNRITDYFEVVVFPGTSNIITMYPSYTPNNRYFVDLNYVKEKKDEGSFGIKRLSQIEKFNKRYGTNA